MIRILMVDDNDDKPHREAIRQSVEGELHDRAELAYIDPNAFINTGNKAEEDAVLAAVGNALTPRVDLVLCDIHLNKDILALPISIARRVRQHNKTCALIMYSGSIHKYLDDLLRTKSTRKGKEVEHPIRFLFDCNVAGFVSREHVEDEAVRRLRDCPLLLHIEQRLSASPDTRLQVGSCSGMTFEDVAQDIRTQTARGVVFAHEVTDCAIDTMLDLSS